MQPTTDQDDHGVVLLRWPDDEERRQRLAASGRPRLLLVAPGHRAPTTIDPLEDWLRSPAEPEELAHRREGLMRRAKGRPALVLDEDGVLRVGDAWVALTEVEHRLVAPLVRHLNAVVHRDDLLEAGWPDGPPSDPRAVDTGVKRVRRRLAPLGARIHAVAGRGYLLECAGVAPSAVR